MSTRVLVPGVRLSLDFQFYRLDSISQTHALTIAPVSCLCSLSILSIRFRDLIERAWIYEDATVDFQFYRLDSEKARLGGGLIDGDPLSILSIRFASVDISLDAVYNVNIFQFYRLDSIALTSICPKRYKS